MEFDCGGDYNYDDGIQEEFWDDGFDNTQDYHQEPAPRPAPPPEPRKRLKMPWQAVLSLQILPGGKVQASTRPWPKTLVDSASRYDAACYQTIPCPHCKFVCTPWSLAEEKLYHRKMFIEDNWKRAEEKAAEQQPDMRKQPRKQRGKKSKDTRPAEEDKAPKRRRPRNNKRTTAAKDKDTETSTPTTTQLDPRDPAECQGLLQKRNPPMPAAEQSASGFTLDAAPEDNDTATTTTAENSPTPSPIVSLVHLTLV